jgi:hypothetical protein
MSRGLLVAVVAVSLAACAQRAEGPEEGRGRRVATPPPASSPLAKVQVGMSEREVQNLLGPPNDENEYISGKAFIPWYFGRDRWRRAYFYRGLGRVVFMGGGGFSRTAKVARVEYDPNESGRSR